MRFYILTILFFAFCFYSTAQTQITGILTDEFDNPVSNASIIILNTNSEIAKAFYISKSDGKYNLKFDLAADSLVLRITHISHKKVEQKIVNTSQTLDFKLESEVQLLDEIIFKRQKEIEKRGDTVSYDVESFKSQKDRVIADVLSKMPGIEVQPDGKILYQGKPIEKYYIEGLDLLEGKYNLANKNLPADAVDKVEILENHQPIQALDSLVSSNETSLNIKLKKGITTTGTAKLGTGLRENTEKKTPLLWEANTTPMFFSKERQAIASYQSNNSGEDISKQLRSLTLKDFIAGSQTPKKTNWLSVRKLNTPNFDENRWLDNQAHLLSVNFLNKLKNEYQLKTNISYLNDRQRQLGSNQTRIFLPTSTIDITENTQNQFANNELEAKFILTKNSKKRYFKNELEIKRQWNSENGTIQREEQSNFQTINQKTQNPFSEITNILDWIIPSKKNVLTFQSVLNYQNYVPSLSVSPLVFRELIDIYTDTDSSNYNRIQQNVQHKTLFTQHSLSFSKRIKAITISQKMGIQTNQQQLETDIDRKEYSSSELTTTSKLPSIFSNDFSFSNYMAFTELSSGYKKKDWEFSLDMPVRLHYFDINQRLKTNSETITRLTFEPTLGIVKNLNGYWQMSAKGSVRNDFGSVNQLYEGYILQNYRSITRNDVPLQETLNSQFTTRISYRNPINSIFFNGFYLYTHRKTNLIWQNEFDENGAAILKGILRTNYSSTHMVNSMLSKFFYKIKTTFSINSSYTLSQNLIFINEDLQKIQNQNLQLKGKINTDVSKYFGLTYSNRFSFMNATISNERLNTIEQQEHQILLSIYPNERNYISLKADFYQNKIEGNNAVSQNSQFFDFFYRYTFLKKSIDLEFSLTNILNTKQFVNISNSSFFYTQTVFDLRPRQILTSVRFKF